MTDAPALQVLWVNHYALTPDRSGGTRHWSLARHLQPHGIAVSILASSTDYLQRTSRRQRAVVELDASSGVPFIWVRTREYRTSTGRVFNMLQFAARALRAPLPARPDLVVGSTPHPFAALAALLLARRHRVPFVLEVRDLWPQSLIDLGGASRHNPLVVALRVLERRLLRSARGVITLLPGSRAYLAGRGGPPAAIVDAPNGIDLALLPPSAPPPPRDGLLVTYAGSHSHANDLDTLLAAARVLQARGDTGIRFRLVGDGPLKPALQRAAAALANVEFLPPVAKQAIHRVLADSDVLVLCMRDLSIYQHGISPNKLFDYLAVGRPLVCSMQVAQDPVTASGGGIVVPAGDGAAIADALLAVQRMSPAERAGMGERGQAWVREHHDVAAMAARLAPVLRQWAGS